MTSPLSDAQLAEARKRIAHDYAILALPAALADAQLADEGRWPVTVVHGDPETEEDNELVCTTLPRLVRDARCPYAKIGTNDTVTYLFEGPDARAAAHAFAAAVRQIAQPWWQVTETAKPRYGGTR